MSKSLDLKTLNARSMDLETRIREARWLESLELNGRSVDDVKQEARDFIEFGEEDSFIGNDKVEDTVKKHNILKKSLISINKLTADLKDSNFISMEEEVFLNAIERRLADKVSSVYRIENLYVEEDNE